MKKILYIIIAACILLISKSYAQTSNRLSVNLDPEKVFDHVINYIVDNNYFITHMKKESGFIQSTIYKKDKRIFSPLSSEKTTLNFIIQKRKDGTTHVVLQIHLTEVVQGDGKIYTEKDRGMLDKQEAYDLILDRLEAYIHENE